MTESDSQDMVDRNLMVATAKGDQSAFESLYSRYEQRIYNYVRTFVRQPASAEEVLVDTMLAVWRGAAGYGQTSRVSTWILGIARHKALDAARHASRTQTHTSLDDDAEFVDEVPGVLDAADDESRSTLVRRAIAQLSPDHREILRLAFYEELSYEEIGGLLAIPNNTVKTRVFYAKQQLRRLLGNVALEVAQ